MEEGLTLQAAAAAAGISERSARTWAKGSLPSARKKPRTWRTREDVFAGIWTTEIEPLLRDDEDGGLEAKSVFAEICRKYPGQFESGQLRTLQRRFREWRAIRGPEREVFFPQQHVPGRMAALDFTHGTELGVTIAGAVFAHLFFHLVLAFSGWHFVQLAYGETFEALLSGLQNALWSLGGVPEVLRLDNLSAATHELRSTGGRTLTKRFQDVVDHYGFKASRIQVGEAHENGVVEKGHDLLKSALEQALRLRGSREFASVAEYEAFVTHVLQRDLHIGREEKLAQERRLLKPLPATRLPEYTRIEVQVRRWSTIEVGKRIYSVPSRLIGHLVEVRQYADVLEVRYGGKVIETLPRLRGEGGCHVDYRHVIWSLVRKPGAFAHYRFREGLFPSLVFRRAYDALRARRGDRADVEYVRVLHLAASTSEATVERVLDELLAAGEAFDYAAVKARAKPEAPEVPEVTIGQPDLSDYDALLTGVIVKAGVQ